MYNSNLVNAWKIPVNAQKQQTTLQCTFNTQSTITANELK